MMVALSCRNPATSSGDPVTHARFMAVTICQTSRSSSVNVPLVMVHLPFGVKDLFFPGFKNPCNSRAHPPLQEK
jgi:hypothetical protein